MANAYTDGGTIYANLLATGYDKYVEYVLRSRVMFRQFVDKHPVDVTNVGPTITLTIVPEFAALATTPLTETVDPDAVAAVAPTRVSVTVNEYGNSNLETKRLKQLAFTAPDPIIANVLGKNMIDTIDKLVQNTYDGATNVLGVNGGTVKTQNSSFAEGSVATTDIFTSAVALDATTLLRRRNVMGKDNDDTYVAVVHPDVAADIISNAGWLAPHQYVDTANIYNAEIGQYLGARYVQTPRATVVTDGVGGTAKVYRTYFLGSQGLVEAMIEEPHTVIGPQVDKLRRFFPVGWYAHGGWSIYRQEAIQLVKTSSSVAGL